MNKSYKKLGLLCLGGMLLATPALAQDNIIKLTTSKAIGTEISLIVNENHSGLNIDWGNGTSVEYKFDSSNSLCIVKGTIKGKDITIRGKGDWYMLDCSNCGITNIDLSYAKWIRSLYCQENQLESIDLRGLHKLEELNCSNNNINKLIFTNESKPGNDLSNLISLDVSNNKLSGRYLMPFPKLQHLNVSNNSFNHIYIYDQDLRSVNASGNAAKNTMNFKTSEKLSNVNLSNNNISTVNFFNNGQNISQLYCSNNDIKELNVTNAKQMTDISCQSNLLKSLDINKDAHIQVLDIANNYLTFAALPNTRNKPQYLYFDPQAPFDITHVKGMLEKDGESYAPVCSNWNDRYQTNIDIAEFCKLANNKFDAKYTIYSINPDGTETELVMGNSSTNMGDYYCGLGKISFFTPHKQVYIQLTSKSYGFKIKSCTIPVGAEMTGIAPSDDNSPALKILTEAGTLYMSTQQPQTVVIFTITGKKVWQSIVNGEESLSLPKGIYVVNGKKIVL